MNSYDGYRLLTGNRISVVPYVLSRVFVQAEGVRGRGTFVEEDLSSVVRSEGAVRLTNLDSGRSGAS